MMVVVVRRVHVALARGTLSFTFGPLEGFGGKLSVFGFEDRHGRRPQGVRPGSKRAALRLATEIHPARHQDVGDLRLLEQ